jgi:hypothetical protein
MASARKCGDEIDRLTVAFGLSKVACEMTVEAQVRDNTVTGDDHLLNLAAEVGNRCAQQFRSCQWPGRSLRASARQRVVDKVRRKRSAR